MQEQQQGKPKSEPYDAAEPLKQPCAGVVSPTKGENFPTVVCKHENGGLAKSDILDSDSPHYTDGHHSSFLQEPADSSHVFDSDFSQTNEDDSLSRSLFRPFPKLEHHGFQTQPSSCNLGFSLEDHSTSSWLWP